jgi:NADH-quinone oxidoreductase subunit E
MLRGAEDLKKVCQHKIHHDPHHLSADGNFSWEEVECLGSCANAPMVQIGSDTYEDLTAESFLTLLEGFSRGRLPKPGSQRRRQASCPEGGPTTLLGSASSAAVAVGKVAAVPPKDHSTVVSDGRVGSGRAPAPVVVGDEAVGETWRPELLAVPRDGRPDDLKLISGIGPMLEKSLNRLGIFHFEQIANWLPPHIKWIDQELEDFRGRAERDKWVEQAKKLASGWRPSGDTVEKSKV